MHSKPRGDGKIPNVIRAYYAAYAPNPSFRPPKKVTPVPVSVPTPISVFSPGFTDRSGDIKDSQSGQLNSKRSYSEANNHNNKNNNSNNLDLNNSNRTNEFNSKVEIYESKKYVGKYYITDPKTNAAVWIEIISNSNHNNNNTNDSINKVFSMNSNIDNFYFVDPKSSLKIGISKAHFIPK